nr:zinc finger, CCHC-type [Tanacetum cinerariifolium]
LVELGSHMRIKESLRMQDSDKPKGNNVLGPSFVNMVEHNNSSRYNDNKGKYAEINFLLDIKIQSEVPYNQSLSVLTIPVLVICEPSVLTPIPETPLLAPAITLLPHLSVSTIPPVLLQTTTPIPTPPITIEAPTITIVVPEFDALTVV